MPLYYFDTDGPNGACSDREGNTLVDLETAQRYARRALCEIASDCSYINQCIFTVCVRDLTGVEVYRASLTLAEPPSHGTMAMSAEGLNPASGERVSYRRS